MKTKSYSIARTGVTIAKGRSLNRSLSAAVLASAMMAGSLGAAVGGVYVDGADSNPALRDYTVSTDESVGEVSLVNDGAIYGPGTLTATVSIDLSHGQVSAGLGGTVDLNKATASTVTLTGSNSYTGNTLVTAGTLVLGDGVTGSISSESDVIIDGQARFELNLAPGSTFANNVVIGHTGVGGEQGNFVVTSSGTTTLSGVVSGSGGFYVLSSTGHTILTGSNTSTGDYGVESGTLQIGDGVSGSISSDAAVYTHENGTLLINLADDGAFANDIDNKGLVNTIASGDNYLTGVISGSGGFTHSGGMTGQTYLTGANTYTGATLVESGALYIGDGITAGASIASSSSVTVNEDAGLGIKLIDGEAFTNNVLNNGSIGFFVDSGTIEFSGQITGTGGFVKLGTGTAVFTNEWDDDIASDTAHYYSGDTEIWGGTLVADGEYSLSMYSHHIIDEGAVLGLNSNQNILALSGSGSVVLDLEDLYIGYDYDEDGFVEGVLDDSATFSGSISGTGDIEKGGYGTWVLSGSSSFEGELEVERGAVLLTGILSQADVDNESFFYGNGYVGGNFGNEGAVYAGIDANPATLTIGGDFYQNDEDAAVFVNAASNKNYSRLNVGGEAGLQGTLVLSSFNGYKPHRKDKLTILTADYGVYGRFDDFESFLPKSMLKAKVSYGANDVVIKFEQQKFAKLSGLTPNQKAAAGALDKDVNKGGLSKLVDKLNVLSLDEVRNAVALMSPEQLAAIFNIGFSNAQQQAFNIERRLDDVRRGSTGFSSNGLALSNSHGTLNYDGAPIVNEKNGLSLAGFDGKSLVGKQTVAPIVEESRWGFFATGSGEWADVESTGNARGSEFRTGGVNIGADYRVNSNLIVGITAGYTNTTSDLFDGGKVDVNSGRGALYASWFSDGFYLNGLAGGAYNSYDTKRSTFGGKADGSTDGGQFDALLGGGYDFKVGGLSIGPVGSLQYTYLHLGSFTESGSNAPLHFASQHQESLKSLLGLKASYTFNVGSVAITPEVKAQWQHEYLDSTAAVESSFAGGGSTFTVNGPNIGRDGVVIDAGVTARFNSSLSVFAYYTGDYGRTNYTSNSVNGGFRINF